MGTKQSSYFKGNARTPIPVPNKAGVVCEVIVTHTFNETVASTDVLEIMPLAAGNRLLSVDFVTANIGAINLNVGFLTGTPGDLDAVRTCGAELFSAVAANAAVADTLATLAAIVPLGPSVDHRSIGLVPAANITAGADKKLHMRVRYVAAS